MEMGEIEDSGVFEDRGSNRRYQGQWRGNHGVGRWGVEGSEGSRTDWGPRSGGREQAVQKGHEAGERGVSVAGVRFLFVCGVEVGCPPGGTRPQCWAASPASPPAADAGQAAFLWRSGEKEPLVLRGWWNLQSHRHQLLRAGQLLEGELRV